MTPFLIRLLPRILAGLLALYLVGIGALYAFQRDIMYPRDPTRPDVRAAGIPGIEEVAVTTADGETLVAWVVPPREGKPVLLFFHGNAGNLARPIRLAKFRDLTEDGTGLFAISYRGYGGSSGAPSQDGLMRDAAAAYEAAARRFGAGNIVAYGESLGTGVAVQLATEVALKALILEAPYVSTIAVAEMRYPVVPVRFLMKDQFRSGELIGRVRAPLMVMHGGKDAIIPFEQGVALYNAGNPPRRFVRFPEGGHENLPRQGSIPQIQMFLSDIEKGDLPDAQVRTVAPTPEPKQP